MFVNWKRILGFLNFLILYFIMIINFLKNDVYNMNFIGDFMRV